MSRRSSLSCHAGSRDGVAGVKSYEIEPGRSVVNNWDRALFEPWAERKARLAAERAQLQAGVRA